MQHAPVAGWQPLGVYTDPYNYFGYLIRELGARMDDFSLEFLNLAERTFGGE